MRRAGRIIYNGAVVVSLLLCLGAVGVWVRSYWVSDILHWSHPAGDQSIIHDYEVYTGRSGLQFGFLNYRNITHESWAGQFYHFRSDASEYPSFCRTYGATLSDWKTRRFILMGFELVRSPDACPLDLTSLTLPLYFPTLLFALLPAHYFLRVRRRRRIASRRARGCCVFCGYDLRASAGRCPECGKGEKATDTAALGTPEGMPE